MTRFGDIAVSDRLAHEVHFQVNPNATLGTNQAANFFCYSYTMPMTGTLAVTLFTYVRSAGVIQEVSGVLTPSSPAPAANFGFSVTPIGGGDAYTIGKDIGVWNTMAAGTVVNIYERVGVGVHPPAVNVYAINGFIRSMRQ